MDKGLEEMARRFTVLCGGNYLCAAVLTCLYNEASDRTRGETSHIATINLASMSKAFGVATWEFGHCFVYLSELAEIIDYKFVFSEEIEDRVVDIKYTVNPERIENRFEQSLLEVRRVKSHNRRAIDLGHSGTLTIDQWIGRLNNFCWRCAYCGDKYEVLEHIIPLTFPDSGTNLANCVPSCQQCNALKGPYHPDRLPSKLEKKFKEKITSVRKRVAELEAMGQRTVSHGDLILSLEEWRKSRR